MSLLLRNMKLNLQRFTVVSVIFISGITNISASAPLTEGWWRVYSRWISQGLVPYKDFNLIVPPGMPYIDLFFSNVFGENFYNLRFVGLAIKCLIALLIFEILKKLITKSYALILSIIGTIILYSTEVVILFDYNYFAIFFLILTVFLWQYSEDPMISARKAYFYSGLSGLALGASILIKLNFAFFLILFYFATSIFKFFFNSKSTRKRILLDSLAKLLGLFVALSLAALYLHSKQALNPMLDSVFRESVGAKGSTNSALFRWILYLFDQYNYRKEFATVIFASLIYLALDRYLLPKYYDKQTQSFKISSYRLKKKNLYFAILLSILIYVTAALLSLNHLARTGFENEWIILSKQIAYVVIPHTFLIPVAFVFVMIFWSLRSNNQNWIPLFTLCLTLIWGVGSSGGLNWYATAIPLIAIFAWVSTKTRYLDFFTIVTLVTSIAIATTTYSNWLLSPYNWWGYRTPSVNLAIVTSDTGLTQGLRMDRQTLSTLKSVEDRLEVVKDCKGGLMVFPHMPIFQLDLDSQPQRRDAVYWFDFVSQSNILKAISEVENNPPAGYVIINVPDFVWDGHSQSFNGGNEFYQRKLIEVLQEKSANGYSSWIYRLYNNTDDWSITVYTKDSCELKK
jgi:hypothetical protein